MKLNNASKSCGFKALAANGKFKHNAQILVADSLQFNSVLYKTQSEAYELTGYLGHHVTRPNGRGGGLSIFVSETINS